LKKQGCVGTSWFKRTLVFKEVRRQVFSRNQVQDMVLGLASRFKIGLLWDQPLSSAKEGELK
jgi:hypothetical protein